MCQSPGHPSCDDPFDPNTGIRVQCSSLQYTRSTTPDQTDVIQNAITHERTSNTTTNQQFCVKLGLQYNSKLTIQERNPFVSTHSICFSDGTPGILRSCHRQTDNVGDPCEFIKRETTILNVTTISACNFCTEDNCNSAGNIYASLVMMFVALLLSKSC